jgi:hypothetical protein
MARRKRDELITAGREERIVGDDNSSELAKPQA